MYEEQTNCKIAKPITPIESLLEELEKSLRGIEIKTEKYKISNFESTDKLQESFPKSPLQERLEYLLRVSREIEINLVD